MITSEYVRLMALYNKWQNECLFKICDQIDEVERSRNRGMFFESIHRTLDHIGMINEALWYLLHEGKPKAIDFKALRISDYAELRKDSLAFDEKLFELAESRSEEWLSGLIQFYSSTYGRDRRIPRAYFLMQLFNHQTHHRSQITSELHKMGIDYGNTDLPYNPYVSY